MKEARKFLFDNFVIEEKPKPTPVETVPEAEAEPVIEEAAPVETVAKFEELPEVKTYSEEELAEKVRIAREEGYENGFKAAQSGIEAGNQTVLNDINNKLLALAVDIDSEKKQLENRFLQMAKEIVVKLVPVLEAENAEALVNKFIAENFANFNAESKISFYLNPEVIGTIRENIAKLANHHDFEGKISLHKDSSLAPSDCRVEWENGGVERNSAALRNKVENLLEAENPQTETNNG